jgi:hypothetical protein
LVFMFISFKYKLISFFHFVYRLLFKQKEELTFCKLQIYTSLLANI